MAPLVDYDRHQHAVYRRARDLPAETVAERMDWFHTHVGDVAPEPVLDLGSGTGRFSAHLAETFGTQVIGIEPSAGMLAEAQRSVADERVSFVGGRAERIALRDQTFPAAFVLNVMHHVDDRVAAAHELTRTVRADGVVVITGSVAADFHQHLMAQWFPSYPTIASEVLPTRDELERDMATGGWQLHAAQQLEQALAQDLAEYADKIALRGQSLLELLPDAEFHQGLERLRTDARKAGETPVVDMYDCFLFVRAARAGRR
jgi:ubiquinone/menaquinone biosynthesis C-methylase UbiE